MTISGSLLLAMAFAAAPPAGPYVVQSDRIDLQKTVWPLYCDEALTRIPKRMPAGTKLAVVVEGAEWTAKGPKVAFGTKNCQGSMGGLAIESRGKKGDEILLQCRSRRVTQGTEKATQRVVGTKAGRLQIITAAERYFRKNGDDCRLKVTRTTVATFAGAEKEAPPEPTKDPCASPGPASEISISPKIFDVKAAGTPRCLEVTAKDQNGCKVSTEGVTFSMDPPDRGRVDAKGCVSAKKSIRETEAVAVVVKIGTVEGAATARLIPKAIERPTKTYKALAKTSRSAKARKMLGEVTAGEIVLRPLETEPPPLEELEDDTFPIVPVAGAGLAALFATLLGVVLAIRRKKNAVVATELEAKPVVTPKKGGGLQCPQCQFEFAVGEATHCPFDGTELAALDRDARQTMFIPTAGGMVCPVCHTKYPTKARFCGHDRSPLLPDFGQFEGEKKDGEVE